MKVFLFAHTDLLNRSLHLVGQKYALYAFFSTGINGSSTWLPATDDFTILTSKLGAKQYRPICLHVDGRQPQQLIWVWLPKLAVALLA